MALTHLSIIALGLIFAQLSDESVAEQTVLANLLASAAEAQEVCSLPGEAFQMMSYVRQVQPSFDVVNDPGDAKAVSVAMRQVKATIRKVGTKSWCELYLRDREELFRTKARPSCDEMPGLCGSIANMKDGRSSREQAPASIAPSNLAYSF